MKESLSRQIQRVAKEIDEKTKRGSSYTIIKNDDLYELFTQARQTKNKPNLSKLLNNIEDLDPEFSKAVDDNFWDLVSCDTSKRQRY